MAEQQLLLALLASSMLAVVLSWRTSPRAQSWLVAACGVGLLATTAPLSLMVLVFAALLTFALGAGSGDKTYRSAAGIALVAAAFLGFMLNSEPSSAGIETRIALPLGLAFYSLRLIHYLFESHKGSLRPHGFDEYVAYLFLPGALPVGPIHRFDEFLRDWRRRRWDAVQFSGGAERVLYGLVKLIVLGNYLIGSVLVEWIGPVTEESSLAVHYLSAVTFWLRLYIVFGGYSDIAVGSAAMMGLTIRENFHWPMVARNIADFWRRWHISLSSWCRDYVFTPVLAATRSPMISVLAAMIVLGLWHEISLRYLLWGAYHGTGIAVFRRFDAHAGATIDRLPPWTAKVWRIAATTLTLHFVIFSFQVTHALERLITGR